MRSGLDVVASTYYRGWYAPGEAHLDEWSTYRIQGDAVGAVPKGQWAAMDSFARNCWYWDWTNRKIKRDLESSGARWMMVRLEELAVRLDEVARFLGTARPADLTVPILNVARGGRGRTTKAAYWDRSQRAAFVRWCGPLMDELYPGWREALALSPWQCARNELLRPLSRRYAFGRGLEAVVHRMPGFFRRPLRRLAEGRRN